MSHNAPRPRRRPRRRPAGRWNTEATPYSELVTRWVLRLLVQGRGINAMHAHGGFMDTDILELALPTSELEGIEEISHAALFLRLGERLEKLESEPVDTVRGPLPDNVHAIGHRLGLSSTEEAIVTFYALQELIPGLAEALNQATEATRRDPMVLLAVALGHPTDNVRAALALDATLRRSGLLQPAGRTVGPHEPMELLPGLARTLTSAPESTDALFRHFFEPPPASDLTAADLPHLERDLRHLTALLRHTAQSGVTGVNILLHGPPGVGKTEMARLAGELAGLTGHEVRHEDAQGKPMPANARQRSFQLCQHLLERDREAVVLFDEAEDCFPEENTFFMFGGEKSHGGKAWFNRLLEGNPVPAIWITNHPERLNPAYLRRFAYTLEVATPPRSVRRTLWQRAFADTPVSAAWLEHVSEHTDFTPAEIRRTSRLVEWVGVALSEDELEPFLDEQLQRQGRLLGRPPQPKRRGADAFGYHLVWLNTRPEIEPVVASLTRTGCGSALLYGPPGTGKTALAQHVAEEADRPLLARPASSILDPYVGMTERKLAALFDEARREGAVLLIDEADSLLGSRTEAQQSWEITRTNELLVQLESFEGILICATNILDALDPAALRRFDHKVELQPLDVAQRAGLFLELVAALDVRDDPYEMSAQQRLKTMEGLTPGDFTTIARRHQTMLEGGHSVPTVATLLDELEQECALKPGGQHRRAGFI